MGCEVYCSQWNIHKVLANLENKLLPSLNGTKYILTELVPLVDIEQANFIVDSLREAAWIPVLAHKEYADALIFENANKFLTN